MSNYRQGHRIDEIELFYRYVVNEMEELREINIYVHNKVFQIVNSIRRGVLALGGN